MRRSEMKMRKDIVSRLAVFVFSLLVLSSAALAQRTFQEIIQAGKQIGIFDFFLPFLLVFAVFYGLLVRSGVFGNDQGNRTISVVIALAAAGFMMVYTPIGFTFSQFLTQFVANSLVAILTTIVVLVLVTMFMNSGVFGKAGETFPLQKYMGFVVIIIVLVSLGIFLQSGGARIFPGLTGINLPVDWLLIAAVILVGIIGWLFVRGGGP